MNLNAVRAGLAEDLAALDQGNVLTYIPEAISAPVWVIRPADPWITKTDPETFCHGSVLTHWIVTAVVDVATNEVTTGALDDMVSAAVTDLTVDEVGEPYVYQSNTALHLAADLTITVTTKL